MTKKRQRESPKLSALLIAVRSLRVESAGIYARDYEQDDDKEQLASLSADELKGGQRITAELHTLADELERRAHALVRREIRRG